MRKRKRRIYGLVAALLFLMLAGCGSSGTSGYVGTWKATGLEMYGTTLSPALFGITVTAELKNDGTCSISSSDTGSENVLAESVEDAADGQGTWKETDDGIELTFSGNTVAASLQDGKLVATISVENEDVTVTFEKQ